MTDKRTVTIVVGALAFLCIMGFGGVIYLVSKSVEVASIATVAGLTGQAFGSLSSLLASTRTVEGGSIPQAPTPPPAPSPEPTPVTLVNEPIEVTDVGNAVPVDPSQPCVVSRYPCPEMAPVAMSHFVA